MAGSSSPSCPMLLYMVHGASTADDAVRVMARFAGVKRTAVDLVIGPGRNPSRIRIPVTFTFSGMKQIYKIR